MGELATVLVTIAFIGICWWAFSPRRKKRFDDAANLPFADDEDQNDKAPESIDSEEQNEQADHHAGDETDRRN